MRKSTGLTIAIFLVVNVSAQQDIDSLHQVLARAKQDTTRINLLILIAATYRESVPDSNLKYSNEALQLSRKINYKEGEINAMRNIANDFVVAGDYPRALEMALEALRKSEALGEKQLIARCLNMLGKVYSEQGDNKEALIYARKCKEIYEETNDELSLAGTLVNMGFGYFQTDQLDSSRIYLNRSLDISFRINNQPKIAGAYLILGFLHTRIRQYDIAAAYCRQAIPTFKATNNISFLFSAYGQLMQIFDSTRRYDSALYYGRLAFHYANDMGYQSSRLGISRLLSSLFKRAGRLDSAFFYQEMAMVTNDSINSSEKEKKTQLLTFNEQLRQIDLAEQKRKDAEVRERNLELAGIAIFIPAFFFFVVLLSKRKIKSRTIEFLGVLSLLFLFEFIVLFIHPYIGHWTHESQIWMLLILVAIAVMLVPLHHRLETWMKNKLATGPKKKLQVEVTEVPVSAEE